MKLVVRGFVTTLTLAGLLGATGCSITKANQKQANATTKKTQDIYHNNRVDVPDSLVTKTQDVFLARSHFKIQQKQVLPQVFYKSVVYTTTSAESVSDTVARLSKLTSVPMAFEDDTLEQLSSSLQDISGIVTYQGSLKKVLDSVADHFGLYWKYSDNKVRFYKLETKVYALDAPMGSFDINNTVTSTSDTGGNSGSSSSSGTSTATVAGSSEMDLKYNVHADSPWSAAIKTVSNMLSSKGKITGNPVEGYVTVTDSPNVQSSVAEYIKKINSKTNKKIAVKIDVFDVETSTTSDFGLDLNAFVGLISNEATIVTNSSSLLNSDQSGNFSTVTFNKEGGNVHKAVLSALNTVGKATEITGATVYTVSGQPAPIQSVQQQTYLASMSTTATTDAGTTSSMEPGTVVTGYSMTVTPKIQSNNQIMINLNLQLSNLLGIETISGSSDSSSASDVIQAPKIHSKNFLENMILHSGQSLLIAGFQDEEADTTTGSPTTMDMWAVGGAKTTKKSKTTTVIVVTPYIIGD